MSFLILALILSLIIVLNALSFYLLVNRNLSFKQALQWTLVAAVINKLFFTGTGYLALSYFSGTKELKFSRILAAFFALEFFSLIGWLAGGIYFGAKIAFNMPLLFLIVLVVSAITFWIKKEKIKKFLKEMTGYLKELKPFVFLALFFGICSVCLGTIYYFFLFGIFGFKPGLLNIYKIVSVAFTAGYLSPAPAGLGFKDAGMVALLVQQGLALNLAIAVALWDRVISTVFWLVAGMLFGANMIKEFLRRRTKTPLNP
jgi:uncharacterized protein (TIRG00374 family)